MEFNLFRIHGFNIKPYSKVDYNRSFITSSFCILHKYQVFNKWVREDEVRIQLD